MKKTKNQKTIAKEKDNSYNKEEREIFQKLPEVKEINIKTFIITFIIVVLLLYSGLLGVVLKKSGIIIASNTVKEIIKIVLLLVGILSIGIILKETLKRDIKDFWKNKKDYLKYGISTLVTFTAIEAIVGLIIKLIVKEEAINEVLVENTPMKFMLFAGCLLAPIAEELIFRGLLRKIIKNKYIYLVASSMLFGIMHMHMTANPLQFLYIIVYAIPGFALAYNYEKTDNIFSPIAMHIIYNLVFSLL